MPEQTPTLPNAIPSAAMPMSNDIWQVVVFGQIDPRQHHPGWYELIGAITPDETKRGVETYGILQGNLAGFIFDVGPFAVVVDNAKWAISTGFRQNRQRIIDVAETVFRKLNEISLFAFDINVQLVLRPEKPRKLNQLIANKISEAVLDLPPGNYKCAIQLGIQGKNPALNVFVWPAISEDDSLVILYNQHYTIPQQTGYFDLGPLLRDATKTGWDDGEAYGVKLRDFLIRIPEFPNAS